MMLVGIVIGLSAWTAIIGLIIVVEASSISRSLDIIATAADIVAEAVANEHDWKVEDRDNRTIDDLPPVDRVS